MLGRAPRILARGCDITVGIGCSGNGLTLGVFLLAMFGLNDGYHVAVGVGVDVDVELGLTVGEDFGTRDGVGGIGVGVDIFVNIGRTIGWLIVGIAEGDTAIVGAIVALGGAHGVVVNVGAIDTLGVAHGVVDLAELYMSFVSEISFKLLNV